MMRRVISHEVGHALGLPHNMKASAAYPVDSLRIIPFSDGNEFKMKAGVIEKNKVNVNVFEASAKFEDVYNGLDTKNENIDLKDVLKVGSMTEPITTGNW